MKALAAVSDLVAQFDRAMAKHLATRIANGLTCDVPMVWRCYVDTRQDLRLLPPRFAGGPSNSVEAYYVERVARRVAQHRRFIIRMPEWIAPAYIAALLLDQPV